MKQVYLNQKYFRPKTLNKIYNVNFFLSNGGLGDYINHMAAFIWIAKENPHVIGRIFCTSPFKEVAEYVMKPYTNWSVHQKAFAKKIMKSGDYNLDPQDFSKFINATGTHLLDLGFMLYCNRQKAIEGYNQLPSIDYPFPSEKLNPDLKYAIFTPGYTAEARAMPARHFNTLVNYTLDLGITPVFLGKGDFAGLGVNNKGYYARFDEAIDFTKGIDLRDKTSLLEATAIMSKAKFVLGIDNGLLHFAGCTEVPIIFGHTVTTVEDRKIRRPKGITVDITIAQESLPCIGCQSNMRFIMGHRFSKCIYQDYKCLDLIFYNECEQWKKAINYVLEYVP